MNIEGLNLRAPPLVFKLAWGEVAKRGVDTLVHVDLIEKPPHLSQGISVVLVVRQVNLLLDGSHKALGVAILPGFPDIFTKAEMIRSYDLVAFI